MNNKPNGIEKRMHPKCDRLITERIDEYVPSAVMGGDQVLRCPEEVRR